MTLSDKLNGLFVKKDFLYIPTNRDDRTKTIEKYTDKKRLYLSDPSGSDPFRSYGNPGKEIRAIDIYGKGLIPLLKQLETEEDPKNFKEIILRMVQLYFDGLVDGVEQPGNREIWEEQLNALNLLLKGVRLTVSGYYRDNKNVQISDVREMVLPLDSVIIKHGSKQGCKNRHLSADEFGVSNYNSSLEKDVNGMEFDLIIPVASGGFEPGLLAADYWDVDNIFPVRYSTQSRNDKEVLVPNQAPKDYAEKQIKGKRVLVVDDIVSSGQTAENILQWVKKHDPEMLSFAAVNIMTDRNFSDLGFLKHKNSKHLFRHQRESVVAS